MMIPYLALWHDLVRHIQSVRPAGHLAHSCRGLVLGLRAHDTSHGRGQVNVAPYGGRVPRHQEVMLAKHLDLVIQRRLHDLLLRQSRRLLPAPCCQIHIATFILTLDLILILLGPSFLPSLRASPAPLHLLEPVRHGKRAALHGKGAGLGLGQQLCERIILGACAREYVVRVLLSELLDGRDWWEGGRGHGDARLDGIDHLHELGGREKLWLAETLSQFRHGHVEVRRSGSLQEVPVR